MNWNYTNDTDDTILQSRSKDKLGTAKLLMEDGSYLLQEESSKILIHTLYNWKEFDLVSQTLEQRTLSNGTKWV